MKKSPTLILENSGEAKAQIETVLPTQPEQQLTVQTVNSRNSPTTTANSKSFLTCRPRLYKSLQNKIKTKTI
jgi:hypothetical protein